MEYMGSKSRYTKNILPIILKDRKEGQWYVEPFVGGFNSICEVDGLRLANDVHPFLIALFRAVQNGWAPPKYLSEQEYITLKNNKNDYSDYLVGFAGFCCSYAAKWFGGYARGKGSKGQDRNYSLESKNNLLKQAPKIRDVFIDCVEYNKLEIPAESIVYCDPPYKNTTSYNDKLDYEVFWDWARNLVKSGHIVFVSEYSAPEDFTCVWEKTVNNSLDRGAGSKKGVEKLWKL